SVVTQPVMFVADLPANIGFFGSEMLQSREQLGEDREALYQENLKLRVQLQQYEALKRENARLRDLLGSSFKIDNRVLVAELSSVDLDPYRQQVTIKKGSASGVFKGQAVLDSHAVMGQVVDVNPMESRVLLITDATHAIPVQVLRNGLRTVAAGTGQMNRLVAPYLPNDADIQAGDQLVTSGLGGKFPPGYPVATVSEVRREPGKPFSTVIAKPLAELDRSREVMLVWEIEPSVSEDDLAEREP
ncbi:MAG: rod shape-determining protein MreC, partial [bacterium]